MKIKKELLEKDYLNLEQAEEIQTIINDENKDNLIILSLAMIVWMVFIAVV